MKREILFRGKIKYNGNHLFAGDWAIGSLVLKSNGAFIYVVEEDNFGNVIREYEVEVIPETIGQFIGLADKTRTAVLEGDLVEKNGVVYKIDWNSLHAMWGLFTESGQSNEEILCDTTDEKGNIGRFWQDNTLTIIGNIHDNPELLK